MLELFADTYALVEILKGNPAYERCSQEELVTSEFNMFELAYALYRDFGRTHASSILPILRSKIEIINPGDLDYLNASEFRILSNKNGKKLSLIDSLGYSCSKRLNIRFLTGDKEFEDVENVEYIK
jgi:uncharacterized protein